MPKIVLSVFTLLALSCGLSMANECQINEISSVEEEVGEFPFKTTLQKNLFIYTPEPKEALLSSDGVIYIYGENNIIGFITANEKFQKQDTIEKTFQKNYFYNCSKPIIRLDKSKFNVFIIEKSLDDKPKTIAVIIDKTDDGYFYLLSFVGFSMDQTIKMLSRR